ncbi:hypothetical protein [Nonomuraea sp. NPDC005692]|uniref:hypothetical protein n=1 Tax=Nonomuraea sp. NPDC005692 TaxID=3157168 RepID=UPI0033BFD53C
MTIQKRASIDPRAHHGLQQARRGSLVGTNLAAALDAIRGRVLAVATGLAALVAVFYTARSAGTARRSFQLGERGHVTDSYGKAVEQLGSADQSPDMKWVRTVLECTVPGRVTGFVAVCTPSVAASV